MAYACSSSTWNFSSFRASLPSPNKPSLYRPRTTLRNATVSFAPVNPLVDISKGLVSICPVKMSPRRSMVVRAAAEENTKKPDSAAKRARQAEKRRLYNKGKKSEVRTRMKKVLEALEVLKKKPQPQSEEVLPVEKLIAEAYSAIDKAVKAGSLHRNTGARRKSRLARRKKAVEIHHGWYKPAEAVSSA